MFLSEFFISTLEKAEWWTSQSFPVDRPQQGYTYDDENISCPRRESNPALPALRPTDQMMCVLGLRSMFKFFLTECPYACRLVPKASKLLSQNVTCIIVVMESGETRIW